MHAMDDMDVPVSVKVEDGEYEEHDEYEEVEVVRVSAQSRSGAVAGAIAAILRTYGRVDVQAIGAGATNQAIKATAIARDYLDPDGLDLIVVPTFFDVWFADEARTGIRLVVFARYGTPGTRRTADRRSNNSDNSDNSNNSDNSDRSHS